MNKTKAKGSAKNSRKCILSDLFHQNCRDPVEYERIKNIIENHLHSKIAELYRYRLISQILQDEHIYDKSTDFNCKLEIVRLRKHLSYDDIGKYLFMYYNTEDGQTLSHLIENVFESDLKLLLINRISERNKWKIFGLNKKIRAAWNDLKGLVDEEDLILYALKILKNN